MLMDEYSKNPKKLFSTTPMDASRLMKKDHKEISNFTKVILAPNKSMARVELVMFRFSKIICIRKIYFSSTIADTKMLMSSQDFQMFLKMCWIKNHNNGVHKLK